jgi:RecA/RadA recombinase
MSALGHLHAEIEMGSILTGSQRLDEVLCDGIRLGSITEISGGSGSGKTQTCLQLIFNAIDPDLIVSEGKAFVISTKRNFCPKRVNQLTNHHVQRWNKRNAATQSKFPPMRMHTREELLNRILHKRIVTSKELVSVIYQLKKLVRAERNVSERPVACISFNIRFPLHRSESSLSILFRHRYVTTTTWNRSA